MFTALLASASEAAASDNPLVKAAHDVQQQFGIEPKFVLMQFLSFAILAIVLYWFGIRPLLATMDSRTGKIEEGLKFADDIKVKLAESEKAAESRLAAASAEAAKITADARKNAEERIAAASQDAIAKANDIIAKGTEAVALERAKMLAEVRAEVARLVVATSGKVLSRELSADEKSRYAESAAKELAAAR